LNVHLHFVPFGGTSFTIIDNLGNDTVFSNFAGPAQGAIIQTLLAACASTTSAATATTWC